MIWFDQLTARKVLRVDQLDAGKKYVRKNIRFKKIFNYFLQDRF